jgi:hypothetical protein
MNEEKTYPTPHKSQPIHQIGDRLRPSSDLIDHVRIYAREKPEVIALWCFGIGFVLGWKLKPW